ncbi:ThuA domain-containing protein [Nonomuraea sp. SMC257]|uniref:ThuA domain-containing protein n=1 Tax=Nonomuraea montanisoli TaxID=2741721 RepID=A0A7Y6M7P6_9ACTN|nr:ThuA domain-containing protein [Nonomuraea montanisoli]NUW36811.1 ThuA domain-containing protein [Nonomuraea montanisoli]
MARNLILSGGPFHDFDATSAALAEVLAEVGIESEITEDIAGALSEPSEHQLITVNALRWRMGQDRFADLRAQWRFELPAQARTTLLDHLERGGGVLAMHAASICFDDWQGWPRVLGGCWTWPKSHHPPLGWTGVRVHGEHPIVEGLRDFDVVDEVYSDLEVLPDVRPLASSNGQPLIWARPVRRGRVVYDALGHDTRSYDNEIHRTLLRRAALWLLKRPVTVGD